jgi:hypothetical protein
MTAEDPAATAQTPPMLLIFQSISDGGPVRPVQVAAVLSSLEEIFLVTLLRDAPPPDHRRRDWAWDYDAESEHIGLAGLRLESPLEIVVTLPWHVYTVPFAAFAYALAHVFGPPATSAPVFDRAREDFWSSRLAGDSPQAEWMQWQAWLEYKHEEVARTVPFRLSEVDIELTLPPASDAPPG